MNTKQTGTIAELKAQYDFMNYGFNVLVPQGDYCPYDIVIEKDNFFWKIQVKSCSQIKNGKIEFDLRSRNAHHMKIYSEDECQIFYLYCLENQQSYLYFNTKDSNTNGVSFRIIPPKVKNKNIKMANDFLFKKKVIEIAM